MPLYIYATGMPRHGDALYIYKYKSIYGTGMPDFWPIQLETGALPNVPFHQLLLFLFVFPRAESC